jgi:GAF domain-containing protein
MTDTYLTSLVRIACEIADASAASLFLVDGSVLRPFITYNLPAEYVAGIGTVRVGSQCCGRAVEHRKPWVVVDMLTDPLFAEGREGAASSPIRAAFSVPVMDGDTVVASLACHYSHPRTPTKVEIERNQAFAKLIAITLKGRTPLLPERPICAFPETAMPLPA